jgi:hypothetical protein
MDDIQRFDSWSEVPEKCNTRNNWEWLHDRRVLPGEEPTGLVFFDRTRKRRVFGGYDDEAEVATWETYTERAEATLFHVDQTKEFTPNRRSRAIKRYWRLYVEQSSSKYFIWDSDDEWISCLGKMSVTRLKTHLAQKEVYGVRAHYKLTCFGGIDADLHEGDPEVFLDQVKVLQYEFHGKDGWHYHLRNEDVGGIHLIQVFEQRYVDEYLAELRAQLVALDEQHPELATRAMSAGMPSFRTMEIFPSTGHGFRLPFAKGRSLYLDRPLPLVKRGQKFVADVEAYMRWVDNPTYPDKEAVVQYVLERLRREQRKSARTSASTISRSITPTIMPPSKQTSGLGRMQGRYAKVISEFWSGQHCPPDSLNQGIQLLALLTPYYFTDQQAAVTKIETMVGELPDHSFSDRLLAGESAKIRKIIRTDVANAFGGYQDQPRPDQTKRNLDATVASWRRKGFDPFGKVTWAQMTFEFRLGPDFDWSPDDKAHLEDMAVILKVGLGAAAEAIKHLIRIVEGHSGELSIEAVKDVLEQHGIPSRSKRHNKASKLMAHLRGIDWIYIAARERWEADNPGGGKARAYGIGTALIGKFSSSTTPILSTYYYAPLPEENDSGFGNLDIDELRIEQRRLRLRRTPK